MLFNSFDYIFLFLPTVYFAFLILWRQKKGGAAVWLLVAASLAFYGYWNPQYLLLISLSVGANYGLAHLILRSYAKAWVIFGVAGNLALLGYYKYADFFLQNIHEVFGLDVPVLEIVLPLGISFFTFQQIALLVDVYSGKIRSLRFSEYVLFVTFFPQLIAGPIVHLVEVSGQFRQMTSGRSSRLVDDFLIGSVLFSIGLFKKVCLADTFAQYVAPVFSGTGEVAAADAWVASLSYTFQIYFDFSGYVDMAAGSARLFGIRLPPNFMSPYKATSIVDFWRRWHITLSRFLRDYLYIPLGGNRHGMLTRYRNLFITMLLGGFWHGANWTFLIWGGIHGVLLSLNHFYERVTSFRLPRAVATVITFITVIFTWVPFRAGSLEQTTEIWRSMIDVQDLFVALRRRASEIVRDPQLDLASLLYGDSASFWLLLTTASLVIVWTLPNSVRIAMWLRRQQIRLERPTLAIALMAGCGAIFSFAVLIMNTGRLSEFLYFQF